MQRTYWWCRNLDRGYNRIGEIVGCNESRANLIGSSLPKTRIDGPILHAPVLDIDFEAKLVRSSTDGHYHLYLDKSMSWWRYKRLLKALYKAGIIEKGYYKGSKNTKQTLVRKPGVMKEGRTMTMKPLHVMRLEEIRNSFDQLVNDVESTENSR